MTNKTQAKLWDRVSLTENRILIVLILLLVLYFPDLVLAQENLKIEKIIGIERGSVIVDGDTATEVYLDDEVNIILDLGMVYPLKRIKVYTPNKPEEISVSISQDGVTWKFFTLKQKFPELKEAGLESEIAQLIRLTGKGLILREVQAIKGKQTEINILDVKSNILADTKVEIEFITDKACGSNVAYGITRQRLDKTSVDASIDTIHRIVIENLEPGTLYYYVARGVDEAGRFEESELYQFQTTGIPPLRIFNISVSNIRSDRVFLNWTTNTMSITKVQYGDSMFYLPMQAFDTVPAASHQVVLDRLEPEKTYYYRIYVEDIYGRSAKSNKGFFTSAEYNIALHRTVQGTFWTNIEPAFISNTPPLIQRVTDGRLDYYTGMTASKDPDKGDQYLILDLSEPGPLQRTEFYWRQTAYPQKYALYTSIDAKDWELIDDNLTADSGVFTYIKGNPIIIHTIDLNRRIARYLKFYMKQGNPYYRKRKQYKCVILHEWKVMPVY
ncbi:MAG: discoidin domain-containing protein [Candidatus Hydrogenedentota bacterium]